MNIMAEMNALGFSDFETQAYCEKQNALMLRRLSRYAPAQHQFFRDLLDINDPKDQRDGDWLACRNARARLIIEASELFKDRDDLHFVTFGHPSWRRPCGKLDQINIDAVKQLVYRRLRQLGPDVLAIGGFEARLSIEIDKTRYWEGHIHLVTAGASKADIDAVLGDARGRRHRHEKPLMTLDIGHLPTRLGYSTKRVVKQYIAYRHQCGSQRRRKLPLSLRDQVEYDLWLLSLKAGERQILHGVRMHGDRLHRLNHDE